MTFWPKSEGAIALPSAPMSMLSDTCLFSSAETPFCIDLFIPRDTTCFKNDALDYKDALLCAARKIGLVADIRGDPIVSAKLLQLINDAHFLTVADTDRFLVDVPPKCRSWDSCYANYHCPRGV